ncbi:MAG: tetratricopeptide repeat protein, partial [Ferruginibacter sp.]|nr:tetratricopeptide repeat protein [Chitinophagaceae bacterium]
ARNINYAKGIAEGARSLGFCYVRLSKNDDAQPLLQESLSLFQSLNDLRGQATVYEYLAIVQRNWGDFGAALKLLYKGLELSQQTAFRINEAFTQYQIGVTYKYLGNFEKALDHLFKSLSIHREDNNRLYQSYPINIIGSIYFENGDHTRALEYYKEGLKSRQDSGDKLGEAGSLDNLATTFLKLKDYPQAIEYCTQSLAISKNTGDKRSEANALQHLAEIYEKTGNAEQAEKFSNESLQIRKGTGDKKGEAEILLFLARLYKDQPGKEAEHKVIEWLDGALRISEEIKAMALVSETRLAQYNYNKQHENFKEAVHQLEMHLQLEKELQKNAISQKVANLEITYKAEETRKEAETVRLKNEELTKLNREIEEQKEKLEVTLADLKTTQAQLIQSEKMASLGELTAGIAHEIQNPLNFVNNFSEVNTELIEEMQQEMGQGNMEEVKEIAGNIKENQEKITHHGKRADAIVKGMLQHSRSSSGVKEPTDINALADEYLRLAYHGLRAKDKSFNATMKTDFDESIGNINIIPQDIGRVVLNLITNAFYAASLPSEGGFSDSDKSYGPTVWVSTKKLEEKVLISVRDNGPGIPQKILDKIFQPFFTTKPTGQGTGLGLSLSYDIVKAHGGEINVSTKENEGTEFIIQLPVTSK